MKIEVRYYSKGGNTKKIADAIANALGVKAESTEKNLTEDTDILFIGSSMYAGKADKAITDFIETINVNIGKAVIFSTSATGKSTYEQVKKLFNEKSIPVAQEAFFCKGSFLFLNMGRPNEKDCADAAEFAKKIYNGK